MLLYILLLFTLDNSDYGVEPSGGISILGIVGAIVIIAIAIYLANDYNKNSNKDDYYDMMNRRNDKLY